MCNAQDVDYFKVFDLLDKMERCLIEIQNLCGNLGKSEEDWTNI